MKIACSCGERISAGGDGVPHKAHLLPDRDWFAFWDAIDDAVETAPEATAPEATASETEAKVMARRALGDWASADESGACYEFGCGRLWIDRRGKAIRFDSPDSGQVQRVFE